MADFKRKKFKKDREELDEIRLLQYENKPNILSRVYKPEVIIETRREFFLRKFKFEMIKCISVFYLPIITTTFMYIQIRKLESGDISPRHYKVMFFTSILWCVGYSSYRALIYYMSKEKYCVEKQLLEAYQYGKLEELIQFSNAYRLKKLSKTSI
jgi:hypothetical protein